MARFFTFTIVTYLEKFIGIKSLNTKLGPAGLPPRITCSPHISPLLPKDSKIMWFLLIMAGSPMPYKEDRSWTSVYLNKRTGKVFPEKEEVIARQ